MLIVIETVVLTDFNLTKLQQQYNCNGMVFVLCNETLSLLLDEEVDGMTLQHLAMVGTSENLRQCGITKYGLGC